MQARPTAALPSVGDDRGSADRSHTARPKNLKAIVGAAVGGYILLSLLVLCLREAASTEVRLGPSTPLVLVADYQQLTISSGLGG
jgi:hypothetical protein